MAGTRAVTTHRIMNAARIAAVCQFVRVESSTAMASTGPTSPQVPYAMTARPTFVFMSSRSRKMGMSVPSAVVTSTMAMGTTPMPPMAKFGCKNTSASANAKVTSHVRRPFLPSVPVSIFGSIS